MSCIDPYIHKCRSIAKICTRQMLICMHTHRYISISIHDGKKREKKKLDLRRRSSLQIRSGSHSAITATKTWRKGENLKQGSRYRSRCKDQRDGGCRSNQISGFLQPHMHMRRKERGEKLTIQDSLLQSGGGEEKTAMAIWRASASEM